MFLESVMRFYKSLVKDKDFRNQLETASNPEECSQIMQEAGYDFTQEEFETATAQILEKNALRDLDDSFSELSEEELELAWGGVWSYSFVKFVNSIDGYRYSNALSNQKVVLS